MGDRTKGRIDRTGLCNPVWHIEGDSAINHQRKVSYLSGLEKVLKGFVTQYRSRQLSASNLPLLNEAYGTAVQKDKHGASIDSLIIRRLKSFCFI